MTGPARAATTFLALLSAGCLAAPATLPAGPESLPKPGTGTLRQSEISLSLTSGSLDILVTPLGEAVIRTAAPDTYRRLSGLASRYLPEAMRRTGAEAPKLFLVSFFSESPDVSFVPEEIQIISRGARRRPEAIFPITPGWGQRRLDQRETETAVYAFGDGVDLESSMTVVYGLVENANWPAILTRIQAERARARSRGTARRTSQSSSPYLEILR